MVFIKDPDWYLTNQNTPDKIYSNAIFLAIGLYHFYNKNELLGSLFIFLAIGSTAFHINTNKETLFIDRLAMILVFSYFFNLFYPKISIVNYSLIGILTIVFWYNTEELLYYFLFQLVGLLLFLFYYPMNLYYKLLIIISYVGITYSQLIEQGKYHSLKHIALGLLSLILK
jgi:hypothetical protein